MKNSQTISKVSRRSGKLSLMFLALMVGCLVNYVGDRIIGIRIELFWGLQTFNFLWFLQLFIIPIIAGICVSLIYGFGGKWIAHFPPLIVRFIAYFESQYLLGIPQDANLMPMGWWGFFVILAIECAAIGGVIGEIMVKRTWLGSYRAVIIDKPEKSPENK